MSEKKRPLTSIVKSLIENFGCFVPNVGFIWLESRFDKTGRRVCIQCCYPIHQDSDSDLCSPQCESLYWEEFTKQYSLQSGETPFCKLPGCTKKCYVENSGHTHDYCGRSHAAEHRAMKAAAGRQHRASRRGGNSHSWGPNGQRLGGGGEPSSHKRDDFRRGQHYPQSHGGTGGGGWDSDHIYFYNRDEPFYEFTNFYDGAPINLDGKRWQTTEHYFQAQKFVGTPYVEQIRIAPSPRNAFDLSRDPQVSRWRRSDWEKVKMDVMRKALYAKFTTYNFLKQRLLSTGDKTLVERSPYDSFWGDGGDGSGQNHLGRLLMELRHNLRRAQRIEDVQRDGFSESGPSGAGSSALCESQASGPAISGGSVVGASHPSSDSLTRRGLHDSNNKEAEANYTLTSGSAPDAPVGDLIDLDIAEGMPQQPSVPKHVQHISPTQPVPSNECAMDTSSSDCSSASGPMHNDSESAGGKQVEKMDTE